ncbi:hypothetical protein VSVS05_03843 [Vibrio scophthalmi]|uniref:Uncharacterized protein n=1 Tax=Vibrio scophthalmi TaxID=45658 RepID=A0A1C7FIP3_9VIBR|nr:hypothetical protein VSVS05_03843 [Vibrio scophthalmi]
MNFTLIAQVLCAQAQPSYVACFDATAVLLVTGGRDDA